MLHSRERQQMSRMNRKLEKKMKEVVLQAEDERRHADQYKEQVLSDWVWVSGLPAGCVCNTVSSTLCVCVPRSDCPSLSHYRWTR